MPEFLVVGKERKTRALADQLRFKRRELRQHWVLGRGDLSQFLVDLEVFYFSLAILYSAKHTCIGPWCERGYSFNWRERTREEEMEGGSGGAPEVGERGTQSRKLYFTRIVD